MNFIFHIFAESNQNFATMNKQESKSLLELINRIQAVASKTYINQNTDQLVSQTLQLDQGELNDLGALCVDTGKFTGRSPKDKFIVYDSFTKDIVDWEDGNYSVTADTVDQLLGKMVQYIEHKEIWIRDAYACADPKYKLPIRIYNETPWANLFCKNLFLRPSKEELKDFEPEWTIVQIPSFKADPTKDNTRQKNFTLVDFTRKIILIGGTAYTGEMKKGIFSVLNLTLPILHGVLPMHCSANEGKQGDVALFFGLSGTGKTTLSTNPDRLLIGDDEHGWSDTSVFNFEGGCYAKCIDLSKEKEPEIYNSIKHGALLENIVFHPGTNQVNFSDKSRTENTRLAYPIEYIEKIKTPSVGDTPSHIFFLTCDAFGVLPPISRLTKEQAMYYFMSGYTAKVAGTEVGVTEPQSTFSACFGKAFLPLSPVRYADLLGKKLANNPNIHVWLVNTGWIGGPYGVGARISLKFTRQLIENALKGKLSDVGYDKTEIFDLMIPKTAKGIPSEILNPKNLWKDPKEYDLQAQKLASLFISNFKNYEKHADKEIISAGPSESILS